MKKIILSIIILIVPLIAFGQSASTWFPQGTVDSTHGFLKPVNNYWGLKVPGLATSTTGCLGVDASGWISASGSACGTGAGGSFPFTVNSWGNSTTSTLGFLNGFLSTASSTISSSLFLTNLSQGVLYTGSNSLVNRVATSTLATNGTSITNTGTLGALVGGTSATISLNLSNPNTWTVNQTFNYSSSTIYSSFLTSSSTFANIGTLTFGGVTGSAWSSFCTSITGGSGLCDGTDDTAAGGNTLSTTSPWTVGQLAMVSSNGSVTSIATSTLFNHFTPWNSYGVSTSTIFNFASGMMSFSSTTINGAKFTDLSQGFAYIGSNGKLNTMSSSTPSLSWFTNDLASLSAGDSSITFSGSYNGATARTINLNMANANTWTALQTFGNSTTTYGSFTTASTTRLHVGSGQGYGFIGSNGLFGVISTSTLAGNLTSLCSTITGSAALCDGDDASGAGGGNATTTIPWILYKQGSATNLYNTRSKTDVLTGTSFSTAMNYVINAATTTHIGQDTVFVNEGYYSCDASIILNGNSTFIAPTINIMGLSSSTIIAVDTAKCFDFRNDARTNMENLHVAFKANSNSFVTASTTAGVVQASLQNSSFTNIYGFSTTTGHTGYLFDLIADFRNNYTNISVNNTGNMIRSRNTYTTAQFINGDSHWIGFSFCEINNSGVGTCFDLDGGANGQSGRNNQWIFDDINGISNDSGAGSNDIFFRGNRLTRIKLSGLNMEQFATSTQFTASNGVYVESTKYVNPTSGVAGKAIFSVTDTASANIVFSCKEVEVSAATTILYDKSTDVTQPTVLQGVDGGNCVITNDGGSALYATSTASIVRDIDDDAAGTQWLARVKILGDKLALAWSEAVNTTIAAIGNTFRLVVAGVEMLNISSTGVSISDDADGAITFTGVSTGNDESLTWNYDDGAANSVGVSSASSVNVIDWGTIGADYDSVSITLSGLLGIIDAGGATSFEIPNGTSNTSTAVGQVYFDTTDNQLVVATSTVATNVAIPLKMKLWSGTIASTSVDFVSGGRIPLNSWSDGVIITEIRCQSDAGTSKVINLDTLAGGSNTDSVTCNTTESSDTAMSANYSIAAGTSMAIELGATTGSVDYVTFSVWGYTLRE